MQAMLKRILALLMMIVIVAPTFAADESVQTSREKLLAHPEVMGALSVIDAWIEGRRTFERIPGISVGIVHDQDLLWSSRLWIRKP